MEDRSCHVVCLDVDNMPWMLECGHAVPIRYEGYRFEDNLRVEKDLDGIQVACSTASVAPLVWLQKGGRYELLRVCLQRA